MSTNFELPIRPVIAPLPPGWDGSPQQIIDEINARIKLLTSQQFALFVTGSVEPATNLGPWAKDGREWYYFNEDSGDYEPFLLSSTALGYQISVDEPTDPAIRLWFEIDVAGSPLAIYQRVGTTEPAVWETYGYRKSEVYTKAETQAEILAKPAYSVRATLSADQLVAITGAAVKLNMNQKEWDVQNVYDNTTSRYTAPVRGIYSIKIVSQFDNAGGDPTQMQITLYGRKNNAANVGAATIAIDTPPGQRWFCNFAFDVLLEAADFMELVAIAMDGTFTGSLNLSSGNSYWCISLIQPL
ncbi:hypothetical protein [Thiocapsa sp. N5-Cardenillas]|uniref:hypothetical protein n=1 Tax=Thiocapsa sp. N5-Cardenillas TaxID=3137397 RepID=UPI0035B19B97